MSETSHVPGSSAEVKNRGLRINKMMKLSDKTDRFFFLAGVVLLLSELWKQLTLTFVVGGGHYDWEYFPFQLCSMPMYICLLIGIVKSAQVKTALYTFLMDFGLLGGIAAFFDTSGMHYSLTALTVHSFLWHFCLIAIGIAAGFSKKGSTPVKGFLSGASVYGAGCVFAAALNVAAHPLGYINMFYISPYYPMSQVVFDHIAAVLGNNCGIFIYIGCCVLGGGVMHGFWCMKYLHEQRIL